MSIPASAGAEVAISLLIIIALVVLCIAAATYAVALRRAEYTVAASEPVVRRCRPRPGQSRARGEDHHGLLPHEAEPEAESPRLDGGRRARILAALTPVDHMLSPDGESIVDRGL